MYDSKLVGDTLSQNYIKTIEFNNDNIVVVRYKDENIKTGNWEEQKGMDYHYIDLFIGGEYRQLEVYENLLEKNSIKLFFIGSPIDFNNGKYDSLYFISRKIH